MVTDVPLKISLKSSSAGAKRVARCGKSERGAGKFKAILVTVILVAGIYCVVKMLPPYIAEYQLADKMQEQSRFALVSRSTEEQIRENIYRVMRDLEIPAKKEDIKIEASQQGVKISLDYIVPIDLMVYHVDLHFTPSSETKSLT